MNRRSPPWGGIEAFIVAARVGSFKEAADRLGLSAPAFSRRIQSLEAHVGSRLIDRTTSVPTLTAAGRRYLLRLEPGYEAIREATEQMSPDRSHRALRVGASQSFAIAWLLPRLSRFQARNPELQVTLHTRSGNTNLPGGSADVGILYGTGEWPELVSQKLLELEGFAVCAPADRLGRPLPRGIEDLRGHRLLEPLQPPELWSTWLKVQGLDVLLDNERSYFDSVQVMYEACALGLGVAIGIRPLVEPFLVNERLVRPLQGSVVLPGAYYIAALPAMRRERAVRAFWNWLVEEAAATPTR